MTNSQRFTKEVNFLAKEEIKNLFIDANIWLSLFHYTNDDLEQLGKLRALVGTEIRLFIPEQIYNEVYRNRENKIKDALDQFEKFNLNFPAFFKNYDEYEEFSKKYTELKDAHKEWLRKVKKDIASQSSPADIALRDFFDGLEFISSSEELVNRAIVRFNTGNPPGKDRKYGDAINWETLLESVPCGEDLFFISADKDYASIFDDKQFHPFLAQEWEKKKSSKIIFFKSLGEFLKKHFKDIELRVENEKDELIEKLARSKSFATTHAIVKELSAFLDLTVRQIQDICSAAVHNRQISWILSDDDVYEFYKGLIEKKSIKDSGDPDISSIRKAITEITEEKTREASEDEEPPDWFF